MMDSEIAFTHDINSIGLVPTIILRILVVFFIVFIVFLIVLIIVVLLIDRG